MVCLMSSFSSASACESAKLIAVFIIWFYKKLLLFYRFESERLAFSPCTTKLIPVRNPLARLISFYGDKFGHGKEYRPKLTEEEKKEKA